MARHTLPDARETAEILRWRRSRPARRAPPAAGRSLSKFLKPLEERFGQGAQGLATRWREIVGETLARRTEPVKVTKPRGGGPGALEIRVDGPAAAFIQHQAPEILERVNLFLGANTVNKLRIVQGPVKTAAAPKVRRRPPPLDAAKEAELARSLSEAPDGPLKASLLKLGRAVMRQNSGKDQNPGRGLNPGKDPNPGKDSSR